LHFEVYQEVYHKLFVWQAVLVVKLLGWDVYVLKSISLVYLVGLIGLSWYYLRYLPVVARQQAFSLYIALLLISSLVVEYGFMFRPETMLMFVGFCSWLVLRRALLNGATTAAAAAGLLAGLAALTHLNGIIFNISRGPTFAVATALGRGGSIWGGRSGGLSRIRYRHGASPLLGVVLATTADAPSHRQW